ncbi:sugar phosphate isomerase/epimerase family protein [Paractinoplanes durhamensis]|uniref:Epimerase n=1 Tax=Paractinoplanes durhamensis TaxID=113563 RepID=A0ABQ3YU15_9ACTN|nr:sugar phosphate isomerase/epimerase [Actinoplanes durhamensis]GIE01100.1 epimerase [Actinoplanes durhamensis]
MYTSFHTATLHELPVVEAVDRILAAGYDAVELNAEELPWARAHVGPDTTAEVRAQLRTRAISSIAAHRADLASPNPAARAGAVAWTIALLDLAVDVGAPVVHVIPGDQPDVGTGLGAVSDPGDLPSFVTSLRELVAAAGARGLTLALEPIVNQLVATTDQTLAVLELVPGLRVSFDPSHLQVTTHDVADAADRLGPYVAIAAIKDATGDPADFKFLAQGAGDVDFPGMVTVLRRHGFDGALVVEHEAHLFGDPRGPGAVVTESLPPARELARSQQVGSQQVA